MAQPEKNVMFLIRLPESQRDELKKMAFDKKTTMTAISQKLIKQYLKGSNNNV